MHRNRENDGSMTLTAFQLGKLKIAAHVREELDRAGITAESIQCRSDGVHLPLDRKSVV